MNRPPESMIAALDEAAFGDVWLTLIGADMTERRELNAPNSKITLQKNMVHAIEHDAAYSLDNWTTHALHDLEFAAELWGAKKAHTTIIEELNRRNPPLHEASTMNQMQRARLCQALMGLRDPREPDPFALRMYALGMAHNALLAGQIDTATSTRLCELAGNASAHHYARTPWPAGEWQPF